METIPKVKLRKTKRLFFKLGSCSRTLAFILNREFDNNSEPHERALDPLAGGIIQNGYQCGMLWGASLALGIESKKRCDDQHQTVALTVKATRKIMDSLITRTQSPDCLDISDTDWKNKWSITKHFITGKVFACFKLVEKWAPEAIGAAYESLECEKNELPEKCLSCASEVVKNMGGSEEEMAMVAGFAGGMGLSGNACGALAAAIWMKTLAKCKEQPGKSFFNNPDARDLVEKFYKQTGYEILCSEITKRNFDTLDEHTEFISNGGCKEIIGFLSES